MMILAGRKPWLIRARLLFAVTCLGLLSAVADSQDVPAWQKAAGTKMAFEVATIRPSELGQFKPPSFPLSADDSYGPTGGIFSADFPLLVYLEFAYKLVLSPEQAKALTAQLPKQLMETRFTINARGPVTATKDQMRLMVQALLAERFKAAVHFETKEQPVLVLSLKKPGVTGPKLRPHAEGPPCVVGTGDAAPAKAADVFPPTCGIYSARLTQERMLRLGSRDTTPELMAGIFPGIGQLGRTVVDGTGLTGRYDFTLEWALAQGDVLPPPPPGGRPASDPPAAPQGPTFLEALDEQLGMKVKPGKAALPVLIIDHIEPPSEN